MRNPRSVVFAVLLFVQPWSMIHPLHCKQIWVVVNQLIPPWTNMNRLIQRLSIIQVWKPKLTDIDDDVDKANAAEKADDVEDSDDVEDGDDVVDGDDVEDVEGRMDCAFLLADEVHPPDTILNR
jgi:hypothetical protein